MQTRTFDITIYKDGRDIYLKSPFKKFINKNRFKFLVFDDSLNEGNFKLVKKTHTFNKEDLIIPIIFPLEMGQHFEKVWCQCKHHNYHNTGFDNSFNETFDNSIMTFKIRVLELLKNQIYINNTVCALKDRFNKTMSFSVSFNLTENEDECICKITTLKFGQTPQYEIIL